MAKDKSLADKAVDIKGKQYVLVSGRVLYFNEKYPQGCIATELISAPEADRVIVKASIYPDGISEGSVPEQNRCFTGCSQAVIGEGYINKTATLENAETSAVGRALAFWALESSTVLTVASADEIKKAETAPQSRQGVHKKTTAPEKDPAKELLASKDRTIWLLKELGYTDLKTKKDYEDAVFKLTDYVLAGQGHRGDQRKARGMSGESRR
jgi:hypothetical protein